MDGNEQCEQCKEYKYSVTDRCSGKRLCDACVAERIGPRAGVMHPVDKAFYDLTVQQRDAAWREIEGLQERLRQTAILVRFLEGEV